MRGTLLWSLALALTTACGGDDEGSAGEPMGTSTGSESTGSGDGSTTSPTEDSLDSGSTSMSTGLGSSSSTGLDTDDESGSTGETIEELAVLFIGNSHTYLDDIGETDLPMLVAELAQSRGKTLIVDSVTAPFESLEGHYTDGEALDRIAEGGWDLVVLQERYRPSVEDPVTMLEYVELFDAEIERRGPRPCSTSCGRARTSWRSSR